jgi:hypothetical protein
MITGIRMIIRGTVAMVRVARGIRVRVWARSTSLLLFQATRLALLAARFSTTVYRLQADPTGAFQ